MPHVDKTGGQQLCLRFNCTRRATREHASGKPVCYLHRGVSEHKLRAWHPFAPVRTQSSSLTLVVARHKHKGGRLKQPWREAAPELVSEVVVRRATQEELARFK